MRKKIEIKLIILIIIFSITNIFVHGFNQSTITQKKPQLTDYFDDIDGYDILRKIDLTKETFNMLDLDDYTFTTYSNSFFPVTLYIGYYYSANKAYSAHSPLVCYPSQGWEIYKKPVKATLNVEKYKINYEEIVTSFAQKKELVIYWYQSRLLTNTQIYKNKIDMGYNKLINNDEQHGFIRVSVPFQESSYDEIKKEAVDFINAFYPRLVQFVNE